MPWMEGASDSRHSKPHDPGAEESGGLAVIPLLLKHIEEKQYVSLWQEEEIISMTAGSNLPLTIWKLVPLSFHQRFFFFSFLLFPYSPFQLSSHHNSTHSFNLSSFIYSIAPILSTPLYQSLALPFPLS